MQKRTIGLLGGIGWASTHEYYRLLNEAVASRAGPGHSARIVLVSMDQHDFARRVDGTIPETIQEFLVRQGQRLQAAGADFFIICANGAHRFAADVVPQVPLPFVSIVEETAARVHASGIKKVGLLGVKPASVREDHQQIDARWCRGRHSLLHRAAVDHSAIRRRDPCI